ncbi:uncharacterized protein [Gossypium hirsutum]|uniref:Aminotransferase-like plant mobile domain-containing protein n=1 Tax=Gossypium hirsutum TaxID=3635 RepID=A0ABM2ZI18_GOSHI|nr:uncharacterized protein LOC121213558 [Gossypium hirsutum]
MKVKAMLDSHYFSGLAILELYVHFVNIDAGGPKSSMGRLSSNFNHQFQLWSIICAAVKESEQDGLKIALFSEPKSILTEPKESDFDDEGPNNAGGTYLDFTLYAPLFHMHNVDLHAEVLCHPRLPSPIVPSSNKWLRKDGRYVGVVVDIGTPYGTGDGGGATNTPVEGFNIWWNHPASYRGIPTELEDIRLLLEQRSEAEFQWTPYEDLAVRTVIPEEFLQNPNAWHVKVVLINYATVEPHQTDRVLRQFGCRQPIPADPEEFDEHHKIDLQLLGTDWPLYWSVYTEMWENRNEYLPTREPIIVLELACVPEYMPWFRAHGKPYLLTPEERRRQIRVGRERRGPQNPRGQNYKGSPSTRPRHSPGSSSATMQSPSPTKVPT